MQLGMIGLGRMGANMVRRLMRGGPRVRRATTCSAEAVAGAGRRGRRSAPTSLRGARREARAAARRLADGAGRRRRRRRSTSSPRCSSAGDIVIDGGNSYYHDDIRRAEDARGEGHPLRRRRHERRRLGARARLLPDDRRRATTSVQRLDPIFATLAPGVDAAPRTPGRSGEPAAPPSTATCTAAERRRPLREDGPQRHRVRPHGRLRRGPEHPPATPTSASTQREADAETTPLRDPEHYQYDLDLADDRRGLAARQRRSRRGCST